MTIIKKLINKIASDLNTEEKSILQALKKRPQAPFDFLMRYQNILKGEIKWNDLDFNNQIVMELGCGPHLGLGPLALYLGAKKFIAVEPKVDSRVFESKKLIDNYFRMAFKDFNGIYRKNISFEEYFNLVKDKTIFYKDIKQVSSSFLSKIDIQLSNSCLEHVTHLNETLSGLKKLISVDGKFIHAVDFGNHLKSKNPFMEIYNLSPEKFKSKHGNKINLIHPSKMLRMFFDSGFDNASLVSYYYFKENFEESINDHWINNLEDSDFFLKVGIIAG